MLKWLKKMAKWFKADEVYEIEEIVLKDDEHLDLQELENRGVKITTERESNFFQKRRDKQEPKKVVDYKQEERETSFQDVDAKVSYQYPKGAFRFPVIPDYLPGERERKQPKVRKQSTPTTPIRSVRERAAEVEPLRTNKSKAMEPPNVKQEETRKRPFVPAEIPSPVYGFQQRPKKEQNDEYEFELTSNDLLDQRTPALYRKQVGKQEHHVQENAIVDLHIAEANQPQIDDGPNNDLKKHDTQEINITGLQQASDEPQEVKHVDTELIKNENLDVGNKQMKEEKPTSVPQDAILIPLSEESKQVWPEEKIENNDVLANKQVEVEPVIETTLLSEESNQHVVLEANEEEPIQAIEKVESVKDHEYDSAENLYSMEEQKSNSSNRALHCKDEKFEAEPIVEEWKDESDLDDDCKVDDIQPYNVTMNETAATITKGPQEIIENEEAEIINEQKIEQQESIHTEEEPKRKHIPFNVVMLRQDKEKLKMKYDNIEKKTTLIKDVSSEASNQLVEDPMSSNIVTCNDDETLPYYHFPSLELLSPPLQGESDDVWLDEQGKMLNETLFNFNVRASVVNITQGPSVTQFEVQPEPGVKVNKITNLTDDIKLCLAAQDIRMEAPIPGKHTIGIEIPNRKSRPVYLREILESSTFTESESPLTAVLGLDITGAPVVTDLRKMPHGLIAGATGSGKSVCINTMIISLLYKATPQELKLLLIDPKMVELAPYNSIPHLVSPVITDVKAATAALKWAVDEMERRYELFAHTGVRDISRFNKKAEEAGQLADQLPFIVIIIDELADLMMMSPAEVEESICRIAQKARACGIHLIVATQRPSVDVITGLIKANIPTRIAFSVSSQIDSRTIIDASGAEKLLGRGDMLFLENGSSKTVRLQGTYVSDEEIEEVVDFVRKEQEPQFLFQHEDLLAKAQISEERDDLFMEACEFVVYQDGASTSSLQRRFHIGYNRAARLIDMMESYGIISETRGSKPREVLMTSAELQEWIEQQPE